MRRRASWSRAVAATAALLAALCLVTWRQSRAREVYAALDDVRGEAVLAHPGGDGTQERLGALESMGLDGVEVIHPSHGAEDRARIAALGTHFDLVPSGGSDAHGGADTARVVGAMRVPASFLALQDERVARTRSRPRVA